MARSAGGGGRSLPQEREHHYPNEVVEEGDKYLDSNKVSFVKWGDLEKFIRNSPEHEDFISKVEKYCIWRGLKEGILTDGPNKNFYLYEGQNPSIEGLPLFFRTLPAIEEYRRETNQEDKRIAMIID